MGSPSLSRRSPIRIAGPAAPTGQELQAMTTETGGPFDLAGYRWKSRPVLIFAPSEGDARLRRQREHLAGEDVSLEDRQVVVIEAYDSGDGRDGPRPLPPADAARLRRDFKVEPGGFVVVLVGKDGGEKARWTRPALVDEISIKIDAMPMRRQEIRDKDE